jgi:transposase
MTVATDDFSAWLTRARVSEHRLTPDQRGVLLAAFHFRQSQGEDSYSTRLLSHFLLHAQTGLKVAQIARLVGVSRPTASGQQGMSSKQAVQQAHHRMDGRPYGKLLPRFAGPIIEFLLARPQGTRADLIDFIDQTFGVHVSRIALYKFLKKFGLDHVPTGSNPPSAAGPAAPATPPAAAPGSRPPDSRPTVAPARVSALPFCSDARASPARS